MTHLLMKMLILTEIIIELINRFIHGIINVIIDNDIIYNSIINKHVKSL